MLGVAIACLYLWLLVCGVVDYDCSSAFITILIIICYFHCYLLISGWAGHAAPKAASSIKLVFFVSMGLPGWRSTDGTGTTERVGDGIVHLIFTKSSIYTPSAQWPRRISLLLLLILILSLLLFIACVIVIVSVIAITIVIESLPRIPPGQVVGYGLYVTCHSMFITCSLKTSWSLGVPSWASLGPSWGCLGRTWRLLGFTLGLSWAMLGPSRGYLGRTWGLLGTLGLEYRTWKTHTFLKVLLEHRPPQFLCIKPCIFE